MCIRYLLFFVLVTLTYSVFMCTLTIRRYLSYAGFQAFICKEHLSNLGNMINSTFKTL